MARGEVVGPGAGDRTVEWGSGGVWEAPWVWAQCGGGGKKGMRGDLVSGFRE